VSWDPLAPETLADPGPHWAALLREAPVHHYAKFEPPFFTLSRHADVAHALRDIDTYSSQFGQGPRFTTAGGLLSDPPEHTRFRKIVQRAFKPTSIEGLRPRAEAIARELLDALHGDALELHDDFACPLPVIMIAELLGVPASAREQFKRWSDVMVEAMGMEDPTPLASEMEALGRYLAAAVADHRARPRGGDLIDTLVEASETGDGLSDAQVTGVVSQLLVGGNETTTSLITNCVWRLLERPALWAALCANPALVPAAIEESLRFDPPVLGLFRTTTRDVTLHGVTIPAKAKVYLAYAGANRDPAVFAEPDRFRLDPPRREASEHLGFGLGVHHCLGAALARVEAETALRALVARFPRLSLASAGERIKPWFLWGRRTLPLRVGAAS
jgi:cytochrome P450